jgi:hypothetical protein
VPGMEHDNFVTIPTMLSGPVLLYCEKRSVNIEYFLLESFAKCKLKLTDKSFFSVHSNTFHRKSMKKITFSSMRFLKLDLMTA